VNKEPHKSFRCFAEITDQDKHKVGNDTSVAIEHHINDDDRVDGNNGGSGKVTKLRCDAIDDCGDAKDEMNDADTDAPQSSVVSPSSDGSGFSALESLESLPSTGSALHSTGECRRCNFFAKGRCGSGKDCEFCHFPHEKRKLTRHEKRERQVVKDATEDQASACKLPMNGEVLGNYNCFQQHQGVHLPQMSWSQQMREQRQHQLLQQQEKLALLEQHPSSINMTSEPLPAVFPFEFRDQVQEQLLQYLQLQQSQRQVDNACEEEIAIMQNGGSMDEGDELQTLAYSVLPGLPPMRSVKLPAPLPLPGMAPPGLLPPGQWQQPDLEGSQAPSVSPVASLFLSTVPDAREVCELPSEAAVIAALPQKVSVGTQTDDEFVCPGCDGREGVCDLTAAVMHCRRH